jgi:hypothetical protein
MLFTFLLLALQTPSFALNVQELLDRAEQQSLGKTFQGRMHMNVQRPEGNRDLEILSWTDGRDKALVKVLKPEKDRGTANLRREMNLWQYLPKIERTIKVPPSLMLQSWMGSDFTNDDLVKSSRLSRDYLCTHEKDEKLESVMTAKLICRPKPDAPVVWGRLELWIEPKQAILIAQDFFTENGEKVKEMRGTKVKTYGAHTLASQLSMKTLKKNTTTILEYMDAKFDTAIDKNIFSQSYLQAPLKND